MDIRDHGDALLQSLAEVLPLDDKSKLVFDENNECFLTLDHRIVLMFYLDEEIDTIIINILLGVLPEDDSREEIMFELLCANYCWNLTEGGTLGVDKETAVISMSYPVQLPLDPPTVFEEIIAKLVNAADFWISKLKEIAGDYEGVLDKAMHPHLNKDLVRP